MAAEDNPDDRMHRLLRDAVPSSTKGVPFGDVAAGAVHRRRWQRLVSASSALVVVLAAGLVVASGALIGSDDRPDQVAGSPTPTTTAGGEPSSARTSSPTSLLPSALQSDLAAAGPVTILALDAGEPVLLYVDHGAVSGALGLRSPGEGRVAVTGSLSAGTAPVACAVWVVATPQVLSSLPYQDRPAGSVVCYRSPGPVAEGPGVAAGSTLTAAGQQVTAVAVRADGAALAWVEQDADGRSVIAVADLQQGLSLTDVRRIPAVGPDAAVPGGPDPTPYALAWAGDTTLAVSVASGGRPDGVIRLEQAAAAEQTGWRGAPVLRPVGDGYTSYGDVVSADATSALALESDPDRPAQAQRAVRIDLATGRVLDVVAATDSSRTVTAVAGSDRGRLVVTDAASVADHVGRVPQVTLHLPGERRAEFSLEMVPPDVLGMAWG